MTPRQFVCEMLEALANGLAGHSPSEYSNLVLILLTVKAVIIGKDEQAFAKVCDDFAVEQMSRLEEEMMENSPEYKDWLNNAGKEN